MIFHDGLGNPEGPVLLADGSWLFVEMHADRGCVSHIAADGTGRQVVARTGRPNGLAVDSAGTIWVAESVNPPSLLRMSLDGSYEVFMTGADGVDFLFPNDLAFGPDGALYMTDTGIPLTPWHATVRRDREAGTSEYRQMDSDGRVWRLDLERKEGQRLDTGLRFTNGIAFDAVGNLYANETITGDVLRYRWDGARVVPTRERFANVFDPEVPDSVFKGPDGMAFDTAGRLYVTVFGQGDVAVLEPDGGVAQRLELEGPSPTNVAFGPDGQRRIYVTEQGIGRIEVYDVGVDGLALYDERGRRP
jgi:gluconolactonase